MSKAKIIITIEKEFSFDEKEVNGEEVIKNCKKALREFPYDFLTKWGENTVLDVRGIIC